MPFRRVIISNFVQIMRRFKRVAIFSKSVSATRIIVGPQELRTADATIAEDVIAGRLTFAGKYVQAARGGVAFSSIFDIIPPSAAFAQELHGFGWLRHMGASSSFDLRRSARAVIADWIVTYGQSGSGFAMQPHVLSRRLISFVAQAPHLLDGASSEFYHEFMRSLSFQAAILYKELKLGLHSLHVLPALIALNYYGQCTDVPSAFVENVEARLLNALKIEILPDGGHISRNPQLLLELVLDLLPLQQVFVARERIVPQLIPDTIAKMLSMLRLLRHSDGTVAAFNGMGATENGLLARIIPYLQSSHPPVFDASYSGYQRVEKNQSVLLVDAGRAPPVKYSLSAHAGCLSFEFSSLASRIIVNCGTPLFGSKAQVLDARQTVAHSVLSINGVSSYSFCDDVIIDGVHELSYGRELAEDGEMLVARHDGYAKCFGLIHQRSLWLQNNGLRLEGQDTLSIVPKRKTTKAMWTFSSKKPVIDLIRPFALRFHLYPNIKAELNDAKTSIKLSASGAEIWQFSASGFELALEQSVYYATQQGSQKTQQIVISGFAKIDTVVDWVLERV
jgi:uncharacterized heparinase superfamily protein